MVVIDTRSVTADGPPPSSQRRPRSRSSSRRRAPCSRSMSRSSAWRWSRWGRRVRDRLRRRGAGARSGRWRHRTGSHVYTDIAVHHVVVEAVDARGDRGRDSVTVVVYQPGIGHVTGGGWLDVLREPAIRLQQRAARLSQHVLGSAAVAGEQGARFDGRGEVDAIWLHGASACASLEGSRAGTRQHVGWCATADPRSCSFPARRCIPAAGCLRPRSQSPEPTKTRMSRVRF